MQNKYEELLSEVIDILNRIRTTITPETDVVWTHYKNIRELTDALDNYITRISEHDKTVFNAIALDFTPTGSFQELSISNGWGNQFIVMATKFDRIHAQICTYF